MSPGIICLPILIPLAGAAIAQMVTGRRSSKAVAVGVIIAQLVVSIYCATVVITQETISMQAGGWEAPYGITLMADRSGVLMLVLAGIIALATTLFTLARTPPDNEPFAAYLIMLAGASGVALSLDLFNLYVWFEVMLAASFVLLTYTEEKAPLKAALVYICLNLLASAFYLVAVGVFYRAYGALDLPTLSIAINQAQSVLHNTAWTLLIIFFLVKLAAFPFFVWLPSAYPHPPIAVTALFAGIMTKLAFFGLLRLWTQLEPPELIIQVLYWLSAFTLISGAAAALAEKEIRRIACWLLAAEMGYLMLAVTYSNVAGLAASLYLIVHMALSINALLLVAGLLEAYWGHRETNQLSGVLRKHPALSAMLALAVMALAGAPPLSGFIAKLGLLQTANQRGDWWALGVILVGGSIAFVVLGRLWARTCWGKPQEMNQTPVGQGRYIGAGIILILILAITFGAGPMYDYCLAASHELLNPRPKP